MGSWTVPILVISNGFMSNTSTPSSLPKSSNRSRPVACCSLSVSVQSSARGERRGVGVCERWAVLSALLAEGRALHLRIDSLGRNFSGLGPGTKELRRSTTRFSNSREPECPSLKWRGTRKGGQGQGGSSSERPDD